MTAAQIAKAIEDARGALASQYVGLDADDWDVANSRSSAEAALNLVELFIRRASAAVEE